MNPREKALAMAAAGAVALGALRAFVLSPLAEWRETVEERVATLSSRVARGEALIGQSALWRRRGAKNAVPEIASANALMKDVDALARATGVRIVDFRPEGSKKEIQVAVTAEAPWGALSRFGYRLSRESDALRLEKVEIQRVGENVSALKGRFVISLKDIDM